jgi:hypothetical protein
VTIEELAERIPAVQDYCGLWIGGNESGLSVWQAKFKLADAALLACAAEIARLEESQHDS